MEKIRELLGRLNSLTPDELDSLKAEVITESDRLLDEDTTVENVASLTELAEASTAIKGEVEARTVAQAEAEASKEAARAAIAELRGEPVEDDAEAEADAPAETVAETAPEGDDGDAEGDEEDEDEDGEAAPEASEVAQEVAVTAASSVATVARGTRPKGRNPEAAAADAPKSTRVMVASAFGGQEEARDSFHVAEVMSDRLSRLWRDGPPQGPVLCASAQTEYPEDRDLRGKDAFAVGQLMEQSTGLQAILASGGICLPVNVDYTIDTWATADRPLRDGLPAYQATRGGLRFVEPPDIGALGAATGIWTQATDAEPLAATKPVFSVACGTEQLTYVAAVSTRVGFGNMQARFQPEMVAANTDLAIAAAARKAEINLLELIAAKATKNITSGKVIGATRDLITALLQAKAAFIYSHRLPKDIALTIILPNWIKDVLKIDLARETAHQQNAEWNVLMISDAQVESLFTEHGFRPIFTYDSLPVEETSGKYPTQQLALQAAGAINVFPTKLAWIMFPEGAVQFLDGGRLDLGVVRDSTLDATNDYETFVETFEGIANRGFAKAIQLFVTELCANGQSGATATVATCA